MNAISSKSILLVLALSLLIPAQASFARKLSQREMAEISGGAWLCASCGDVCEKNIFAPCGRTPAGW